MAKVHHQHPQHDQRNKNIPHPPPPRKTHHAPISSPPQDTFVKEVARGVYEANPLVMLCTRPELRLLAMKVPLVGEIADAVCPALESVDRYVREDLLK